MSKRGNNIYKRKDGRWEARFVKGIGTDGKKIYGSVYGKTYSEARDKQLLFIQNCHITNYPGSITLSGLMWEWLSNIENSVKKTTYQKYKSMIRNHIDTHTIGSVPIRFLSSKSYSEYSKDILSRTRVSSKTVNDILVIVNSALSYAEDVYNIKKPKITRLKEHHKEMRVLSVDEQKQLEQYLYANMNSYKMGVLLALYTGIRIGELCALQWEDVKSGSITISKTLHRIQNGKHTIIEVTEPKTESSNRTIPIPPFLQQIINQFHRETGSVLINSRNHPVEPRLMQLSFNKMIESCGLPKANFHSLRHTFATRCIEAGFDVKSLSEILGHADIKTTLNQYVHSSYELKRKNMELLKPTIAF